VKNRTHNIRKSNGLPGLLWQTGPPLVRGKPSSRKKEKVKRQKAEYLHLFVPSNFPHLGGNPEYSGKGVTLNFELDTLNLTRGVPLLYQLSIYPDRERGDPAHDPVLETSVNLCVVSALPARLTSSGWSAVKNETETEKQNFAGQHRLPNKGRPHALHPGLSGFGGGISDVSQAECCEVNED